MTVPKTLYHGTTMLRWSFIQKDGVLRSNMRKSFEAEDYYLKGYVFLTNNADEAVMHGLSKSLLDKPFENDPEKQTKFIKLNPNYMDPLVIGVKASKLGDNFEINYGINTSLGDLVTIRRRYFTIYSLFEFKWLYYPDLSPIHAAITAFTKS